MPKLSYRNKITIYQERKQGNTINNIFKKCGIRKDIIKYLIRLIDKYRYDILKTSKNSKYITWKKQIIIRVLINNDSACSVAVDEGLLSFGMLFNWMKKYKENYYNIVERKWGHPTINEKEKSVIKNGTQEEIIKRLKKRNLTYRFLYILNCYIKRTNI